MMGIGDQPVIALFPVKPEAGESPKPRPGPDTLAMRHFAFRTDRAGLEQAQEALRSKGIDFYSQDHDIAHSIYFNDPDGHEVEITTYEV